ncbi:succinylglutamate desuccinylase/aspartoacylase family protein [Achromobacter ruhlandii]|uniref:succinylglutamate desuccinylase/aspartoacylase domain-containing protein n=1 Tax=Achromobacter ruhlandii TaxID=72557 RepID=UPI0021F1D6C8|nr:succinylglutamate desuccinylase/aspartoacylase family protein [Achromobacter ruhlandii]MCV6796096.1 succinylglutamate desuccinylase/aspartoacylase family protein [Achromobacter ruhlandii]MCV6804938.1 succinylglutamate desuccinylase/aspartoacylase family protein [Achromobacter ruhlandii]MCV6808034.1 succinylglutamate desuccinylase/aspartoacylase family protein [Achromobacter ruhlandii]MCV6817709.1 succinylglutamate desuccinylase/aspartoacylase family protein [Achromobacter ruhlandii]
MIQVSREDFSCAAATNASAYRRVTIPVLRIEAGPGPAVALMAGVHGDEWEGQAAILQLWQLLPGVLQRGTVYLLPAANAEASLAGTRLSPSDGGNLNRAFLGAPARGYTESVAAALEARLLPRIQALVDVHSGGASLRYLPSSVITRYGDDPYDERLPALARAFGMPHCVFFRGGESGSMPAAASRLGVLRLSAEIGGGGETTRALAERCRDGLLGCLAELGLLAAATPRQPAPLLHDLDAPAATLRGREPGVFIPAVDLGQTVTAGQTIGQLIEPARPDLPARALASPQAGTVVCLRAIARSDDGDCLLQVAPALPLDSLASLY